MKGFAPCRRPLNSGFMDLIWEPLDLIWETLDIILRALDIILEALDVILEALRDILGMAWVLRKPGDVRMGWIALSCRREHCFQRIHGSR